MSQAASQWAAFARDVAAHKRLWTIKDDSGFPTVTSRGQTAHPFWSSRSRVEKVIRTVPAYSAFQPHELSWEEFRDRWVPGMTKDGLFVGVNWSGSRVVGYDVSAMDVKKRVEYELGKLETNAA